MTTGRTRAYLEAAKGRAPADILVITLRVPEDG